MATPPDLAALDPRGENSAVSIALAFLRLVVRNNPNAKIMDMLARPDVKSAHQVISDWLSRARAASTSILTDAPSVPDWALEGVKTEAQGTLAKLRRDTRISRANIAKWRDDDPTAWAAQIVLRMNWFREWLQTHQDQQPPAGAQYKTWVSRLAENTCKYCARLHGTTIPITDSFAPYAQGVGFPKVYGGLFGPPMHPNCQCGLRFA